MEEENIKSILHSVIIRYIIDNGHAPNVVEISKILDIEIKDVEKRLQELQEYHGVVLHPNSSEVFVIHPFACFPTNFYIHRVNDEKNGWFSNCGWCSLGASSLIGGELVIRTSSGGRGCKNISIHVKDGDIILKEEEEEKDIGEYLIHFPIPMKEAWNNVVFTCANMLIFETEKEIEEWCRRFNMKKGSVQKLRNFNEFAKEWYGKHILKNWKKWTIRQAKEIFQKHGLKDQIWDLSDNSQEIRKRF